MWAHTRIIGRWTSDAANDEMKKSALLLSKPPVSG